MWLPRPWHFYMCAKKKRTDMSALILTCNAGSSNTKLAAFDVRGKEVDVIFEGAQSVGQHSYTWNASNLPSGVYYIRLQAGSLVSSQKALLIK